MADLSITAADVVPASGAGLLRGTSGATITAGMACYLDSTDQRVKIAHCETSATTAAVVGIAANGASAGQPVTLVVSGGLDLGATLTVGEVYVLSASGGIAPVGDLLADDYVTVIGIATAADNLAVSIASSGVQVP